MNCIEWKDDHIRIIDQTKLPLSLEYIDCFDLETLGEAIRHLSIRGAPALGIAGAFGIALAAVKADVKTTNQLIPLLWEAKFFLASLRPTAANLCWAMDRMLKITTDFNGDVNALKYALISEAKIIASEDKRTCRLIGAFGSKVIKDGYNILHHCNTGFLATGEYGTALGVIRSAYYEGKKIHVWVNETRPLLQGARLTAWELSQDRIPYTLISDNVAGFLMKQGKVDVVVVGADRITSHGDVANKIGTYSIAVLAKYHNVPFYVAAPFSTIDFNIESGDAIVIEERPAYEVTCIKDVPVAPLDAPVYNPAFDVTPAELVTGIITERGIISPPYLENLKKSLSAQLTHACDEMEGGA